MTKDQLDKITIPLPFAGGTGASVYDIQKASGSRPNYEDGFPANYSAPREAGGSFILRSEMNGLGKMASHNQWFQQAGGYYTFDPEWSNAQTPAGYPKDAILQHIQDGLLISVRSLVDNNTWDFRTQGIDGVHWGVCTPSALMFPRFDKASIRRLWSNTIDIPTTLQALSGDIVMPFDGFINYISDCTATIPHFEAENLVGLVEEGALTSMVFRRLPQTSPSAISGCMMGVILGITTPSEGAESSEDVYLDTSNPYSGERNCAVFTVDGLGLSMSGSGCGLIACKKGSKIKVFGRQTFSMQYSERMITRVHTQSGDQSSEEIISVGSGSFSANMFIEAYPISNQS